MGEAVLDHGPNGGRGSIAEIPFERQGEHVVEVAVRTPGTVERDDLVLVDGDRAADRRGIVRAEDSDGARGWGEVWCNFPNSGAEYRARLFADIVAPRALGRP